MFEASLKQKTSVNVLLDMVLCAKNFDFSFLGGQKQVLSAKRACVPLPITEERKRLENKLLFPGGRRVSALSFGGFGVYVVIELNIPCVLKDQALLSVFGS